jgi:hypothetical protein
MQVSLRIVLILILAVLVLAIRGGKQDFHPTEMAAVRDIQTIVSMQAQYMSQFGKYAASLAELGPAGNGVRPGPWAADLIPASLASGQTDGYLFRIARTPGGYSINAEPIVFGKTGRRTFYTDQSIIIHQNWGPEPSSADSPEFK